MKRIIAAERDLAAQLAGCDLFGGVEVWNVLSSTNDRMHTLALNDAPEGVVVVAEGQTAGRGRRGRSFVSSAGDGLYMSLLLRPKGLPLQPGLLTAAAAVAVHRAVGQLVGLQTDIKWVNDLYYAGKKLCGILAEGQFDAEGRLLFVTLGIGVNLKRPTGGYDPSIADIVTSLQDIAPQKPVTGLSLCASVVRQFAEIYAALPATAFLNEYRAYSCVLGQRVTYQHNGQPEQGLALAIDEQARLVVQQEGGRQIVLETGEVTLLRMV